MYLFRPLALYLTTLATLATAGKPWCENNYRATRADWTASCITELRARATDTLELSGPAYGNWSTVCLHGDPTGGTSKTTTVVVYQPHAGTFHTTMGDIACGAQAILDACAFPGGLTGGSFEVCGTEDFVVVVDGWQWPNVDAGK